MVDFVVYPILQFVGIQDDILFFYYIIRKNRQKLGIGLSVVYFGESRDGF